MSSVKHCQLGILETYSWTSLFTAIASPVSGFPKQHSFHPQMSTEGRRYSALYYLNLNNSRQCGNSITATFLWKLAITYTNRTGNHVYYRIVMVLRVTRLCGKYIGPMRWKGMDVELQWIRTEREGSTCCVDPCVCISRLSRARKIVVTNLNTIDVHKPNNSTRTPPLTTS